MDFCCFYFPLFCIHWLMGYHILPADPAGDADHLRTYTMGILPPAEMGKCLGQMADKVLDGTFLRGNAVFRGVLRAAAV